MNCQKISRLHFWKRLLEEIYVFTLELLKTACFFFFPSPSGDWCYTCLWCDKMQAMNKSLSWFLHILRQQKALARGTEPREDALWDILPPQARLAQPMGTLKISPAITNLWCVALLFQIFDNEAKDLEREVCFIDIACDEIPERYYKESEVSKWMGWHVEESQSVIHSSNTD